jgi:putative endonuclease
MCFVYVLKSITDQKFYYGFTDNLERRLSEHNGGKVPSTRSRIPFELVYFESVATVQQARSKERYFKSGFGRKFLKKKLG